MSYTKTNWTKGDVITAEKLNKMEDGIEQASSGGSGEFDFKAFCQEWGPIMAAGDAGNLSQEDQMAVMQAMNEIPQNIYIHCSGTGSGPIVADEDYGDYFLPILQSVVGMAGHSVTLVTDISVGGGMEIRTYLGPLFLDNNSTGSSLTYYDLRPASGKWCSHVYTQNDRKFIQETTKFLAWEDEESAHFEAS